MRSRRRRKTRKKRRKQARTKISPPATSSFGIPRSQKNGKEDCAMKRNQILGLFVGMSLLCALTVRAQETRPGSERLGSSARGAAAEPGTSTAAGPLSQEAQAAAPRLVKFTGVLSEVPRTPLSGPAEMTLALYRDELGGEPVWTEMQSVEIDKQGRYTVLLGA